MGEVLLATVLVMTGCIAALALIGGFLALVIKYETGRWPHEDDESANIWRAGMFGSKGLRDD